MSFEWIWIKAIKKKHEFNFTILKYNYKIYKMVFYSKNSILFVELARRKTSENPPGMLKAPFISNVNKPI